MMQPKIYTVEEKLESLAKELKDVEWQVEYHDKKLRDANRLKRAIEAEIAAVKPLSDVELQEVSREG